MRWPWVTSDNFIFYQALGILVGHVWAYEFGPTIMKGFEAISVFVAASQSLDELFTVVSRTFFESKGKK